MKNILLCGFMGCGKTTVGKRLARLAEMEYLDLDAEIEAEAGIPIPEIFSQFGEAHFRDLEHAAVRGLSRRVRCVISTGGGAMTFPRNAQAVDPCDLVVFLDAPFEVCLRRIENSDRPLVRQNTPEQLRALFELRRTAYLRASSLVADGSLPPLEAAAQILEIRDQMNGGAIDGSCQQGAS